MGAAGAVAGCALWPHWYRVPLADSGLVGEWAGLPAWSHGDTIVWRFDSAGAAARSRIQWRHEKNALRVSEKRESLGHWRVYDDSARTPRRFVCFEYGRERARPPCWYYAIEPPDDRTGARRRALKLLGQVGGPARAPEVYAKQS